MLTEAIFYHPEPFFLGRANKGSGKFGIRYSLLSGSLKLFFTTTHYYRRFDICTRGKRRKWPQKNRSTKCWDKARHHARTPRNFIGGNPTGSAVKTNGRAGTRTSGSSKGSPELGLANDSRELLNKKKRRMPCSYSPSFGLISWKLHGLDETQYNAGAQYVARRVKLTDRVPIFNRKVRAIISRSLTAKFYHAKRVTYR